MLFIVRLFKHHVSETGVFLRPDVEPTHLGPIDKVSYTGPETV
jgi:hypothetical protein